MFDHDVPTPRRLTRRSALAALAATAGAIAVGDAFGLGAAHAAPGGLDDPGSALATARRMRLAPPTTPTTPVPVPGVTTYTAPVPPPSGKVMFPLGIPLPTSNIYVLNNFGDCRTHEGLDILAAKGGNPIFAVADGELVKWYTNTGTAGWGWTLFVAETNTTYKYFHMADNRNGLNVGDRVTARGDSRIRRQQRNQQCRQFPPALRGAAERRAGRPVPAARHSCRHRRRPEESELRLTAGRRKRSISAARAPS